MVTIAFACVSIASSKRYLSIARPDDITLNYSGVARSAGTSQIIIVDSGANNVWSGGAITGNDNCTIIVNVSGNGNTITNPVFACAGSCTININVRGNVNTLTTTAVSCVGDATVSIDVDGPVNTLTSTTLTSNDASS